eukprot:m.41493 g.41493  ORF g.41493 m.41493 type:complete len:545 (+) comp10430_c0_seq2:30-1664(+)
MARKGCCSQKGFVITLFVIGAVLLVIGLVAEPGLNAVIRSVIKKDLMLTSDKSQFYPVWKSTKKIPIYMTFYMFNVTNPLEVQRDGVKPHVEVVGPFNYNETREKFDIEWIDNKEKVRFKYSRIFYPLKRKCPPGVLYPDFECTIDDSIKITTPNVALMGLVNIVNNVPYESDLMRKAVLEIIQDFLIANFPTEWTFVTLPARELIFGYNDTILASFNKVIEDINHSVLRNSSSKIPLLPAVQVQTNNSMAIREKYSVEFTGKSDMDSIYSFDEWAGYNQTLPYWAGTRCPKTDQGKKWIHQANMLNGTDGIAFQPNINENSHIYAFSEDLRRSALLAYETDITFDSIPLKRFVLDESVLANVSTNPAQCAFDAYAPYGVLNLTNAIGGPAFASKPHFLDADPVYLQMVDGLAPPNRTLHDTTIDVEPYTGSSFRIHDRLQVSVHLKPTVGIAAFENITEAYIPMLKVDEHATVTNSLLDEWKAQVGIAIKAKTYIRYVGIGAGPFLIVCGLVALFFYIKKKNKREPAYVGIQKDEEAPLLYDD